jgi:hypothetical protein
MKVSFEEADENVIFRISEFDSKYEKILQMCYYENDGRGYIKIYPQKAKYIDKIKKRYFENAKLMFDQLGYFAPVPWEKALAEFCERTRGTNIDWWLTGSCAACIRGIKMNPHDVDIMTDSRCVGEITDVFSNYLIEPIVDTGGWLTKDFGVIFLHARIDIASDPQEVLDIPEPVDCGPYAEQNLETIEWNSYEIRVPPLELQLTVNKKRERVDRVKLIEDFMNQ